jgi:5-methyltetrahydropteroyltriglutamate--homocysteine methyltransferase
MTLLAGTFPCSWAAFLLRTISRAPAKPRRWQLSPSVARRFCRTFRHWWSWGSWHGPHTHDLPLKDIVDILLKVRAQAYVIEVANARHEHEWQVWRGMKLPDGKILIPGVISHATNVVEHSELVAWRIKNFASVIPPENIIAGTDCGLGYRVHPQIAWAKLTALSEGAREASKSLWKT